MRKFLGVILVVAVSGYVGFAIGVQKLKFEFHNWRPTVVTNKQPVRESEVDFALFWTVWDKMHREYVDKQELDPKKMVEGAISGMVSAAGDPYTVFLPVAQNEDAKQDLNGAFEGVGIQLGFKDKQLAVVSPLEGTPAYKAGVKSGDLIIHIKDAVKQVDQDTIGMTVPEAVTLIRGKKGTTVTLTFIREGQDKPFDVDLTRDTIVVKSVVVEFVGDNNVAHLKLNRFGDRTQEEWLEAVSQIVSRGDGLKGVVLDVRNNPGGYLDGAVYMAGEFLTSGKLVVSQQYGDGTREDKKVLRNGRLTRAPLVVLINEGSASAAEILAGALRDHNRAKLVGMKSFGKGSVQQPEDFPDGSGIHITIAKWLRPNGDWIDKQGIKPDIEVAPDPEATDETQDLQLQKAIELL